MSHALLPARAVNAVFTNWYRVEPEAAVAAITPEIAALSPQTAALLVEHRLRNGATLDELKAQTARKDSSVTWAGLVEFAAEKASGIMGTEAALAILREPEAMAQLGRESAVRVLAAKAEKGAATALDEVPLGPNRDSMMRGVLRNMAVHEPSAALEFLARENSERPSSAVQLSYGDFFKAWLNADPAAALEGIAKIQDPTVQANFQTFLHQRESDVDWNLVDAVKASAAAPAIGHLAPGTVSSGQ